MEKGDNPPPYQQGNEVPPYPTQQYPSQQYPAQPYPTQTPAQADYIPPPQPPQQTFTYQGNSNQNFDTLKQTVPSLPMCMAAFCLVINCILPGIGTIIAGFASLCCADTKGVETGKVGMFCINFWIGIAQLLLIVFGIGWVWSIFWGFLFIHRSGEMVNNQNSEVTVITTTAAAPVAYSNAPLPQPAGQDNGTYYNGANQQ